MLKFATLTSSVELPFWAALASQKINKDRLDDSARRILGVYRIPLPGEASASCCLEVHADALTNDVSVLQS